MQSKDWQAGWVITFIGVALGIGIPVAVGLTGQYHPEYAAIFVLVAALVFLAWVV